MSKHPPDKVTHLVHLSKLHVLCVWLMYLEEQVKRMLIQQQNCDIYMHYGWLFSLLQVLFCHLSE